MFEIVPATVEQAAYVGRHLRPEDAAEMVLFGVDSVQAAGESVQSSVLAQTLLIDGVPAAVFGLALTSMLGGCGNPWLLTTPAVERARMAFSRSSRPWLERMLAIAPRLENIVDARYLRCIAWLEWLGFTVEQPCAGVRRFWMER